MTSKRRLSKIIRSIDAQPPGSQAQAAIVLAILVFAAVIIVGLFWFFIIISGGFNESTAPRKFDSDSFKMLLLCAVFIVAGIAGYRDGIRRMRHASDTPTSKIHSAAQGYVELKGTLIPVHNQPPLLAPLSGTPCLYWKYDIQKYKYGFNNFNNLEFIEEGSSDTWMSLADETGECFIDPTNAHATAHQSKSWNIKIQKQHHTPLGKKQKPGTYCCTEHLLLPEREAYALGYFRSVNGKHVLSATGDDDSRPFVLSGQDEAEMILWARIEAISGAICCLAGTVVAVALLLPLWH